MTITWSRFVKIVRNHQRFLLTSHLRPDCDGLGSELGLAVVLETLGKQVCIVNPDPAPEHLAFIDPEHKILVLGEDRAEAAVAEADVMMVLDTSAWVQLGPMADVLRQSTASKVVMDHHGGQAEVDATVFKDATCESTGRLVLQAAEALGVALTPAISAPLFAAITTDTGWFRFASVSGATLRAAGQLIDAGAQPAAIYAALYEQNTLARLLLRGRLLAATKSHLGGRLLVTYARRADFDATGALPGDTEDVVNMLLSVRGSQLAVIFQEQVDGKVKASLRSRSHVDVRKVAEQFGGGGHTAAAGAMLDGPVNVAETKILDALRQALGKA